MMLTRKGFAHCAIFMGLLLGPAALARAEVPAWLPRYDLEIHLDVAKQTVTTRQRVTWTNRHNRPARELVFNAHSHYQIPESEIGFFAKTIELLRVNPADALDTGGPALEVTQVTLHGGRGDAPAALPFHFAGDTNTDLVIPLPHPVGKGESVTVVIEHTLRLPQKQGRWGQWRGVTFLSNWLPVLAVYDEHGWHPTPFVPWHQPFFNEAGVYTARVILPRDQKIACTGSIVESFDVGDGWRQVAISAEGVRDFAFLCSARYREYVGHVEGGKGISPVRVRVLAFPEHEHYAKEMVRIACETIPTYGHWFGAYPYPEFTVAESFFGWNGNECATLVMIDERVFGMPKLAGSYVDYLVSHEICHQWWYNLVGTNGHCETWMDEALATHFSHKWVTCKHGGDNNLMDYPRGLRWLPNIRRQDYRAYGMYGTFGRGDNGPVVRPIDQFGNVANLFSLCYDKGSRIVGIIANRLGEAAFRDFIRIVHRRYRYRILRVEDFRRELEEYTGRSWEEFFRYWVYGAGICDWSVEKVEIEKSAKPQAAKRVTVILRQNKPECAEPTTLGIALHKDDEYSLRIPVLPQARRLELEEVGAVVEPLPNCRMRVVVMLPCEPVQVAVDPDQVLVDSEPANNFWKKPIRWRATPLYTFLEETDLTNAYDRWNVLCGPWVYAPAFLDPWYTRSALVGARAGLYRTQHFVGGLYAAYRTDFRDVVAGADGLLDHWPHPHTQLGFNVEQRLHTFQDGRDTAFRGVVFARHILQYGSSLYLPPMEHVEAFAAYQDNFLPFNRNPVPGARRYDSLATAGVHYHKDFLTPYWDPAAGYLFDLTYAGGSVDLEGDGRRAAHQLTGQVSLVKGFPDLSPLGDNDLLGWSAPLWCWLAETRLALRVYGAGGLPDEVEYFPLGGGSRFRGYDQAERQGSLVWLASVEWRVPLAKDVRWDCCDHVAGIRNAYAALFYDVGDARTRGRSAGPVAHALGVGLRLDTAFFGFVERSTIRLDVAKTVNDSTPVQFWFGFQHPF